MLIQKLNPEVPTPKHETEFSAGLDLVANIPSPITLSQGTSVKVPTGLKVAIPAGHVGFLLPRSSKGNQGLNLKNTVGVIDADYRGEVLFSVVNRDPTPLTIASMERIGQLVVVPYLRVDNVTVVDELPATVRGEGGFGSTGS